MTFNTISVIGLGYIGLPTAAMFASRKKQVIGVDIEQHVVDTINCGKIHIIEPDLENIVHTAVTQGYLKATIQPEPSDAFLIAVPTPFRNNCSDIPEPDISYIELAANSIAQVLKKGDLVVLESTSPVGTTEQMAEWLALKRPDLTFPQQVGEQSDVNIAYCPERVLPGQVVRELVTNDRVIGGMTNFCAKRAVKLYKTFVEGDCVATNSRTAEMAKLTENACRDVQIAFANELSIICDNLDINPWELISLANRHPRINILQPGPGVGGHCIAVDPWFIVSKSPEQAKIIRTARHVNDAKPGWVIEKVKIAIMDFLQANPEKSVKDVTIACLGLTFKANIDDLRESPALKITQNIAEFHEGQTLAVEPHIDQINTKKFDLVGYNDAILRSDIVLVLVDHTIFKEKTKPVGKKIIDTRGIWE